MTNRPWLIVVLSDVNGRMSVAYSTTLYQFSLHVLHHLLISYISISSSVISYISISSSVISSSSHLIHLHLILCHLIYLIISFIIIPSHPHSSHLIISSTVIYCTIISFNIISHILSSSLLSSHCSRQIIHYHLFLHIQVPFYSSCSPVGLYQRVQTRSCRDSGYKFCNIQYH